MTLLQGIKPELLPTANVKIPERWRRPLLPPLKKPRARVYSAYLYEVHTKRAPRSATTLVSETTPLPMAGASECKISSGSHTRSYSKSPSRGDDKGSHSAHRKMTSSAKTGQSMQQEASSSAKASQSAHGKTTPSARTVRSVHNETSPSAKTTRSARTELMGSAKTSHSAAYEHASSLDKSVPLGLTSSAKTRSVQLDVRPPSVYSDYSVSIKLRFSPLPAAQPWVINNELNIEKVCLIKLSSPLN